MIAVGNALGTIIQRIRSSGPLTFAEFMEIALYDPIQGYYTQPPVGARGDFVTSPHVSSGFAELLAVMFAGMARTLGSPLDLIETGAGDGTLARDVLKGLETLGGAPVAYRAVEISAGARVALSAAGFPVMETLNEIPVDSLEGCILAHEMLDNMPFHRLRCSGGVVTEVFIDTDGAALIERGSSPTKQALDALGAASVPDGEEVTVSPATLRFMDQACAVLRRGYVLVIDYGSAAGEQPQSVRGYRAHQLTDDLLSQPGATDITTGVDFAALAARARALGHHVFGPRTQREVLKQLGFDDWYARLRQQRLDAEARRDTRGILKLLAEQSRAPLLVDAAHLGAFKMLAIGVGIEDPPKGFL